MTNQPESTNADLKAAPGLRALCVRLNAQRYRAIRTIAVSNDLTNAEVISWAMELLERYVAAGGER
jgi:hypothetical protein